MQQRRDLIRRPTTMADAFLRLSEKMGIDTTNVRVPSKREPSWRVTRKG
jgi:hypothetical protein